MLNQQTCKICGRPDKFDFNVPDDIWQMVIPKQYQNHVVCLTCFDDFACKANIPYHLQTLYFVGNKQTFIFQITVSCAVMNVD